MVQKLLWGAVFAIGRWCSKAKEGFVALTLPSPTPSLTPAPAAVGPGPELVNVLPAPCTFLLAPQQRKPFCNSPSQAWLFQIHSHALELGMDEKDPGSSLCPGHPAVCGFSSFLSSLNGNPVEIRNLQAAPDVIPDTLPTSL